MTMYSIIKSIQRILKRGKFTSNEAGANVIRRFIRGHGDPYEWDDFETVNEENPDVDLAIRLCWYFAAIFPAKSPTEYCANEASPYFLAVADALEKGFLGTLDSVEVVKSLKKNQLPDNVKCLLNVACPDKDGTI